MIADIRERLDARPFVPFTIHVADGREYRVATPDDAHVHRNRARVSVFTKDGREFILPALLISGIGIDAEQD
jgi:hypothetical protein